MSKEDADGNVQGPVWRDVYMSLQSPLLGCREEDCGGMNYYGDRSHSLEYASGAKLVRNLVKHRRTPMSPAQLIPPTSMVQAIAGDGRLTQQEVFFRTDHHWTPRAGRRG